MRIEQIIKRVNNTECGKGSTHESYIFVNKGLSVAGVFDKTDDPIDFKYSKNGKYYTIRLTEGREQRIVGFGPFYTEFSISAGDTVLLEKREYGDKTEFYVDYQSHRKSIFLSRTKQGYEVLNPERMGLIGEQATTNLYGDNKTIKLKLVATCKKRQDSPDVTSFYAVLIDGVDTDIGAMVELEIQSQEVVVKPYCSWKVISIKTEDENE